MSVFDEKVYDIPDYSINDRMAVLSGKNVFDIPYPELPLHQMHVLVCGAPRMGKTVQIQKIMAQTMSDTNSTHVVFDPKGEAYKLFYREGIDHAISLFDVADIRSTDKWNLMKEAAMSAHPETTLREIAKAICKEAINSSPNPFFPESAELLIASIWILIYRKYKNRLPCNDVLIEKTRTLTREALLNEAENQKDNILYNNIDRLTDPNGKVTTINIRQEMERILAQAFNPEGNFCSKGEFSVIDFIRNAKSERLFLVYDFATAENSWQIYNTMLTLMFKETLSLNSPAVRNFRRFFHLDELPLLNYIETLDSLCCFGAGLGNRVICGIQGLSQLYDIYGEDKGNAILSAFTDNIIMKANDPVTIERLSRRSGQKNTVKTKMGATRLSVESRTETVSNIPEDVMSDLDVGEAIMSIRGVRPFFVKLDE